MLHELKNQASPLQPQLQVFYASQTGHGETVGQELGAAAAAAGLSLQVRNVLDLKPAELRRVEHAVFIISTHGEGDPPDDALDLFEYLQAGRPLSLQRLSFNILALGDRSYEQFCAAGRALEALLLAQGAQAFAARVESDVDYGDAAGKWAAQVIGYVRDKLVDDRPQAPARQARLSVVPPRPAWTRDRPFAAAVQRLQKITGPNSHKDVYHLELSLEGSGLRYEPGDALGVRANNRPELVEAVLAALDIDPAVAVSHEGEERSVRDWLVEERELTRLAPETVSAYAGFAVDESLRDRLASFDSGGLREFIEQRQFIDLAEAFPARLQAADLVRLLRPLTPRIYSIASSQAAVEDEVHLTVVTHRPHGAARPGLASHYLNHRLQPGDEVRVFVEPNRRFRLPDDRSAPLILIAAGTGIAPYRAFMQQLEEEGCAPKAWLIFGNPSLRSDFLYQRDWLRWRKNGQLQRIDGAFSRDQAHKRYVQHVVREQAADICAWLDEGARIYLCGGLAMGQAVEAALLESVAEQKKLDAPGATAFLSSLRRDRRLLKDLY